jgi:hypothetical protein
MKKLVCLLFVLGILAPGALQADDKPTVDFTDPVKVVFKAARTGDVTILASLCDPEGENDNDTRVLCGVANDKEKLAEFFRLFVRAKVTGKAYFEGSKAVEPFVFGPEGKTAEQMYLVNRGGKWYLSSF